MINSAKIFAAYLFFLLPSLLPAQQQHLVVPVGHTGEVTCVAFFSLAGKQYILTGSNDFTAKLWNLDGKEIQTFKGHDGPITSVAFSPNGEYVLTGSEDARAMLWRLDGTIADTIVDKDSKGNSVVTDAYVSVDYTPHLYINGASFSPGGDSILTCHGDGTARLWGRNGSKLFTFPAEEERDSPEPFAAPQDSSVQLQNVFPFPRPRGHDRTALTSVAFSTNGKRILAGSSRGAIIWDRQGKEIREPSVCGDSSQIRSIAYSPVGDAHVAVCGTTLRLVVNDMERFNTTIDPYPSPRASAFSPDGRLIDSTPRALAFSPDGKHFLTSKGDSITIWNLQGQQVQKLHSRAITPNQVAFSPDSKSVLAISDGTAKLWSLDGRELLALRGYSDAVTSAAFSPKGNLLFIGSGDGTVKMWGLDGMANRAFPSKSGGNTDGYIRYSIEHPFAYSPEKQAVLTIFQDSLRTWTMDGREAGKWEGNFKFVDVVNNGKTILTIDYSGEARLWDWNGAEVEAFIPDTIDHKMVEYSQQNKYAIYAEDDGPVKLWNFDGQFLRSFPRNEWETLNDGYYAYDLYGSRPPMRRYLQNLLFSPDGQYLVKKRSQVLRDVNNGDTTITVLNEAQRNIYTFSPDSKKLLTVAETSTVELLNLETREKQSFVTHDCFVGSAVFSPDGRYIVTVGAEDHSTKIWEPSTGQEVATLISLGLSDWVVTMPSGLFDASPGAMQLMHYAIGLDVVELEQLKERYYEPGLLQKLFGFSTDPIRSVEGFDTVALYPAVFLKLDSQAHQLQIELIPRNGGLGKVSVFINGKEVIEDANPPRDFGRERKAFPPPINLEDYSRYFLRDSLNIVSVRAYNEAGWLKSPAHSLAYRPVFARSKGVDTNSPSPMLSFQPVRDPALYAIIVGTGNYEGTRLDLKFPGKDAEAMALAIQQAGGQLFGADKVFVKLLTTDTADVAMHPTRKNIRAAFKSFEETAWAEDILMVYFSGHGVTYGDADKAQFYYLTQDISSENLSDEGVRNTRAISTADLTKWINNIPAQKQVMIIDACSSGKVVETLSAGTRELNSSQTRALDRMKDRTGMYLLAGSAADKVSYEASQYGQGLLTYSLLEGMSGMKLREGKYVDVALLFDYALDRVPEMAKNIGAIQTPTKLTPTGGSIDIGILAPGQIQLSPKKPVFIRNYLIDSALLFDHLGLTRQLEEQFQDISAKGAKAELIYVDISQFPNAYSIRGLYQVSHQGMVVGRGQLFLGDKAINNIGFTFSGTASKPEALADTILQKVKTLVDQDKNRLR